MLWNGLNWVWNRHQLEDLVKFFANLRVPYMAGNWRGTTNCATTNMDMPHYLSSEG